MSNSDHIDAQNKLFLHALRSRFLIIIIQLFSNLILPSHDAKVFLYPKKEEEYKFLDFIIDKLFGGLSNWDAQYFLHIAIHGYTYENTLAFFPLLPNIVSNIVINVSPLRQIMSTHSITLLIYIFVNTTFFVLATLAIYKLTTKIFNERFGLKCALLFCYNPASIFFSAAYTECIFSYLTFMSIYFSMNIECHKNEICRRQLIKATFFISLSTSVRSNGLLNIGFLLYFYTKVLVNYLYRKKCYRKTLILLLFQLVIALIVCIFPFVYIQFNFHQSFCTNYNHNLSELLTKYGEINGYILPGQYTQNGQEWCNYTVMPLPYGYVQKKYWNVGFLNYFEFKQVPNFLLALPMICIVLHEGFNFFWNNPDYLFHLGVFKPVFQKIYIKKSYNIDACFVCIVHAVALTIFCMLFVHIQVTTRMMCSATPVVYWFSYLKKGNLLKYYYKCYFLLGAILFSTFLPWT